MYCGVFGKEQSGRVRPGHGVLFAAVPTIRSGAVPCSTHLPTRPELLKFIEAERAFFDCASSVRNFMLDHGYQMEASFAEAAGTPYVPQALRGDDLDAAAFRRLRLGEMLSRDRWARAFGALQSAIGAASNH